MTKEDPGFPQQEIARDGEPWRELVRCCNELGRESESWWGRVAADPLAVLRVDEGCIDVRLGGNAFMEVSLRGGLPQCRISTEHLLPGHPGSGSVLHAGGELAPPQLVRTLDELGARYDQVRRRVMAHADRRQALLDRLYLRHPCILGVDVPVPCGRADLVVRSAQGRVVFFLVRRYADGDLRLRGRGSAVWRMEELARWLPQDAEAWTHRLLDRSAALQTRHSRRYAKTPVLAVDPHPHLLVVDFDHAQRLAGLDALRGALHDGLDRCGLRSDIHFLGDAGNISYKTFFPGVGQSVS